jgi:hypothetical protein
MPKKPQPLVRKGDKKQKTKDGLEIPVPKRDDVFEGFRRAARRGKSDPGKR